MVKELYIIHGWAYSIEPWGKTVKSLEKSGIKVKFLLVPGLTSPSKKIWQVEDYADWADENLPKNAIVLGHSNGGRILLNLLKRDSIRVRHLILLNSAGVYRRSPKRAILRVASKILAPLKKVPLMRKIVHRLIGAGDYHRAPENMKRTLDNMIKSDKKLPIDSIDTTTTILWGGADRITPLRNGKLIHAKLKNSKMKVVNDWQHAPYITHPEELAREIAKIIQEEQL